MAASTPLRLSATLVDELGTETSALSYVYADPAQTVTQVVTAWDTWITDLDAITDGQIMRGRVDIIPALPGGLKGSPTAGARVEQTGNLALSVHGTSHRYAQVIPSFKSAAIAAGKIDLTNADVAAFIALLEGATLGGYFTNQTSQQLNTLVEAFLSFRKRRKQLSRSSAEL